MALKVQYSLRDHYDYLIIGSGISGASLTRLLLDEAKSVLVLEKRDHVGGNVYTKDIEGIPVHVYGPHIFHTSDPFAWEFFNKHAEAYPFINSPKAYYRGRYYSLPFNLNTFEELLASRPPKAPKRSSRKRSLGSISSIPRTSRNRRSPWWGERYLKR